MSERMIIIGGGGHARGLIEIIRENQSMDIAGIVDPGLEKGTRVMGIEVLGDDHDLPALFAAGIEHACIGVGGIQDTGVRRRLFVIAAGIGFSLPALVHPRAVISPSAMISDGAQVMAGAVVQADGVIGPNVIINTGAIVEHNCVVGGHAHISTGAIIGGVCRVGSLAFIGAGATVINGISVGKGAVVAAGAVVISDVPDHTTVKGIPAKASGSGLHS